MYLQKTQASCSHQAVSGDWTRSSTKSIYKVLLASDLLGGPGGFLGAVQATTTSKF